MKDAYAVLNLIYRAEEMNVGFSLYNVKHFETGKIEYEAVFYDPWGGPSGKEYLATDENLLRAIDLAFIKLMENR